LFARANKENQKKGKAEKKYGSKKEEVRKKEMGRGNKGT
jgi:hypothetical protein